MLRRLTRISPASVLAIVALFAALGGVSYAAGKIGTAQIKNGAVTKKKLHKNAVATAKVRNGAITTAKLRADSVTGAKVEESTLGTVPKAAAAGNADALAGKGPGAFESKGFGGEGDTPVAQLPSSSTVIGRTQELPAGTFLVIARGAINNNGAEVGAGQKCTLAAGGVSQTTQFGVLAANAKPGDRESFSLFVVATLDAPGKAVLSCETNAQWESGNLLDPTIAAVSLQP